MTNSTTTTTNQESANSAKSNKRQWWTVIDLDELCRIAAEKSLTRAQLGELVILIKYARLIDGEMICYPGKLDTSRAIGMNDPQTSRDHQNALREKGVIQWTYEHPDDPDRRTPRFRLPKSLFFLASDSYLQGNSPSGGVGNNRGRGMGNNRGRGMGNNQAEQQQPVLTEETDERKQIQTSSVELEGRLSIPPGANQNVQPTAQENATRQYQPDVEQLKQLQQKLVAAGVDEYEASLIARQFYPTTIEATLEAALKNPYILNRGGWIRSTIERRSGKLISYPNSADDPNITLARAKSLNTKRVGERMTKEAKAADGDYYLQSEYYQRRKQQLPDPFGHIPDFVSDDISEAERARLQAEMINRR